MSDSVLIAEVAGLREALRKETAARTQAERDRDSAIASAESALAERDAVKARMQKQLVERENHIEKLIVELEAANEHISNQEAGDVE